MFLVGAIIGLIVADSVEGLNAKNKRAKEYEEFYRNLTPNDFPLRRVGNTIQITIPEKK